MEKFDHLIVGSGLAAFATAKGIRDVDEQARIGMVGQERVPPYNRPALSKGLWKNTPEEDIWFPLADLDVTLIAGKVVALRPDRHTVLLEDGRELTYGNLMLATGADHRKLPFDDENLHYLRSFEEYRRLREAARPGLAFLVIGGGFLGAELASALSLNGNSVTMVFPEAGINARILPADLSQNLTDYFRGRGVEVLPGRTVTALESSGSSFRVTLADGAVRQVHEVVAATGARPRDELAFGAGLITGDGIVVDDSFRTSHGDVFAAGDVANYPDRYLGRRRVEHEDHALRGGELAGHVMAGEAERYSHIPLFYSDLFDLGYEAVGLLDPRGRTIAEWDEPFRKGRVIYVDSDSRTTGVLMWNSWGRTEEVRQMIREGHQFP